MAGWPDSGKLKDDAGAFWFLTGITPRQSRYRKRKRETNEMSAATPFPWPKKVAVELSLFRNAPVAVAQCDQQGTIVAVNPAMERLLLKDPFRLTTLSDLVNSVAKPEDRNEIESFLREIFIGERGNLQWETKLAAPGNHACINHTGEGYAHAIKWTAWRVPASDLASECALVMAEVVAEESSEESARQSAKPQLSQAAQLETVGRLTSSVAHDFNGLLTGILLYCDLLMTDLQPGTRLRKYAQEIQGAALQAAGLVRQLLDLARPRTATQRLLSLNEVVEGSQNLLGRLIGDHVDLHFNLDPRLSLVKMDPTQARQILLNLVLNARDAMPHGGQIKVETSNCRIQIMTASGNGENNAATPSCVLLVVSDNGCGMDSDTKQHLFEAFFTTKSDGRGTGLGLATVHDIVTNSGGLVHVDSDLGRGTRVTVLLPLATEADVNAPRIVSQPGHPQPAIHPKPSTDPQPAVDFQPGTHEGELPLSHEEFTP
jgi:signal transduction histidine kinase